MNKFRFFDNKDNLSIAVVGATGMVGESLKKSLENSDLPVANIYFLASLNSLNKEIYFNKNKYSILLLDDFDFSKVDLAFFVAGGEVSKKYVPIAVKAGALVIDNSSCFRYDNEVPLVVPEVNPILSINDIKKSIIANPNCSTIQLVIAIESIYKIFGIDTLVVSTYQSVSGAGKLACDELWNQSQDIINFKDSKDLKVEAFPKRIAFNCIPKIDYFWDNGFTNEEMKMVREVRKIFNNDDLVIETTCVRVPVFVGHSESVYIKFKQDDVSIDEIFKVLQNNPRIALIEGEDYPTSIDSVDSSKVYIGRIRKGVETNAILMWVVADNLLVGAGYNAVAILNNLLRI